MIKEQVKNGNGHHSGEVMGDRLKEASRKAMATEGIRLKAGTRAAATRVASWVQEPPDFKGRCGRVIWILAGVGIWITFLVQETPAALLGTPVAVLAVLLWLGHHGPAEEPPSAEEKPAPEQAHEKKGEEFWSLHSPRTNTDGDGVRAVPASVPVASEGPVDLEKMQVGEPRQHDDNLGQVLGQAGSTGNISDVDHVGICEVPRNGETGQIHHEDHDVNGVSRCPNSSSDQATDDVTDGEIITRQDESDGDRPSISGLEDEYLNMHEADRRSIREIAELSGRSRSDVHRMLGRARLRRDGAPSSSPQGPDWERLLVLPRGFHGEDCHPQDVRFTEQAQDTLSGFPDGESLESFIRYAFLGKEETTDETWSAQIQDGRIVGVIQDKGVTFTAQWSETGTVVVDSISHP